MMNNKEVLIPPGEVINLDRKYKEYLKGLGHSDRYAILLTQRLKNYMDTIGVYTLEAAQQYIQNINKDRKRMPYARTMLKHLFEMKERYDLYRLLPKIKLPDPEISEDHFYPKQQILNIIEGISKPMYRLVARIQYDSGCRPFEAIRIHRDNIRFDDDQNLWIYVLTKGSKGRYLFVSKATEKELVAYLEGTDREYLFLNSRSQDATTKIVTNYKYYYEAVKESSRKVLGVARFSPHDFRRNVAEDLKKAGYPIEAIQTFLGHVSIGTTLRYIQKRSVDNLKIVRDIRG